MNPSRKQPGAGLGAPRPSSSNPEDSLDSRGKLLIIATIVVICGALAFIVFESTRPEPSAINGPVLVSALAQYAKDLHNRGVAIPPLVTSDTLIEFGYLTPADLKAFHGAKLTFYAGADSAHPRSVLVKADMPDGSVQAVLVDGSVRQFSAEQWSEILKNQVPENEATNQQPLPGSGSNGMPMLSRPEPATNR